MRRSKSLIRRDDYVPLANQLKATIAASRRPVPEDWDKTMSPERARQGVGNSRETGQDDLEGGPEMGDEESASCC